MRILGENIKLSPFMLAALLLVAAGLYIEFNAQFEAKAQARISAQEIELMPLQLDQLATSLRSTNGPIALYVYASWCGACRKIKPYMLQALKNDTTGTRFVFLSIDQKPNQLKLYLAKENLAGQFTPYILTNTSTRQLDEMVAAQGGRFGANIPYIAVMKDGKITRESTREGIPSIVQFLLGKPAQ